MIRMLNNKKKLYDDETFQIANKVGTRLFQIFIKFYLLLKC